jgi:hypothetical protein
MGRKNINLYRHGLGLIWHRLKWDLRPESWTSRRALKRCRDLHLGRKAVVVCNGPSLLKADLALLRDVFTLGLNKIHLLFDKRDFRPSCIVAVNPLVLEQTASFYNQTQIPLYLDATALRWVRPRRGVVYLHTCHCPWLARDCSGSVHQGFTVTVVALQLAFHLGFRDVALIGCDHNFAVKGPPNKAVISGAKDESHFDPNYFAGGVPWHLPDLVNSEVHYNLAGEMFREAGGRIINCTTGGMLEIFPRMDLQEWLSDGFAPAN